MDLTTLLKAVGFLKKRRKEDCDDSGTLLPFLQHVLYSIKGDEGKKVVLTEVDFYQRHKAVVDVAPLSSFSFQSPRPINFLRHILSFSLLSLRVSPFFGP